MNKKVIYCAIIALFLMSFGCDDEGPLDENIVDLNSPDNFEALLQSKNWLATSFKIKINCNDGSGDGGSFELVVKDYCTQTDVACTPTVEGEAPNCTEEFCSLKFDWLSFESNFTATRLTSTHLYKKHKHVVNEDGTSGMETTSETDVFQSDWSYNKSEKTLTTNFGDIYNYFDGPGLLTFDYEVVSSSLQKIELHGTKSTQGCTLTIDIVME